MKFILTSGEPASIGPDIILQLLNKNPGIFHNIKIIADINLLKSRAKQLNLNFNENKLSVLHLPLADKCTPGELNKDNSSYVMEMLTIAANGCINGEFKGMITGPIHKGILNEAGFKTKGHTDFLTTFTKTKRTVMMLLTDKLKVALLTDHVPLREVPDLVTEENLSECFDIILKDFENNFNIKNPRILVCGLNPHAGENGHLGFEEQETIIPTIKKYQQLGHKIIGPVSADTAFTPDIQELADVTLAMYHDQGLTTLKYAGFHKAINITLGLPFIRTSVDHGTALNLAGTGRANTDSLQQAILLAQSILNIRNHNHE